MSQSCFSQRPQHTVMHCTDFLPIFTQNKEERKFVRTQSHQTRNSPFLQVCDVSRGDSSSPRQVNRNVCLARVWKQLRMAPQSVLSPKYPAGRNPAYFLSGYPLFCSSTCLPPLVGGRTYPPEKPLRFKAPVPRRVTFRGKRRVPVCWRTLTGAWGTAKTAVAKIPFYDKSCAMTLSGARFQVQRWRE